MKNKSNSKLIAALVIIVILIALVTSSRLMQPKSSETTMLEKTTTEVMKKDSSMIKDSTYSGKVLGGSSSPLLSFNKADYDTAITSEKLVVLYFYANWCPICREEFPKMQAAFNSLTTDQVVGFQVNYNDSETDENEKALARDFGVAYQHTKVFIKNGKRVLKSPEGWDEERYNSEINKLIQ